MSFFKRLFCKHEDTETTTRWIEVNGPESDGKRNKPSEILYEVQKYCNDCYRTDSGYFTEAQLKEKLNV